MAWRARFAESSTPSASRPRWLAAASTVPLPQKGSHTSVAPCERRCGEWRAGTERATCTHDVVAQEAHSPDGSIDAHRLAPRDVAAVDDVGYPNCSRLCSHQPAFRRRKCEPVRERRQLAEAHDPHVLTQRYLMEQLLTACVLCALATQKSFVDVLPVAHSRRLVAVRVSAGFCHTCSSAHLVEDTTLPAESLETIVFTVFLNHALYCAAPLMNSGGPCSSDTSGSEVTTLGSVSRCSSQATASPQTTVRDADVRSPAGTAALGERRSAGLTRAAPSAAPSVAAAAVTCRRTSRMPRRRGGSASAAKTATAMLARRSASARRSGTRCTG